MDPYSGRTFELGEDLVGKPAIGSAISPGLLNDKVKFLDREPTPDERHATHARALVAIAPEVAHQLKLGGREAERRQRRRKAAKQARKQNR